MQLVIDVRSQGIAVFLQAIQFHAFYSCFTYKNMQYWLRTLTWGKSVIQGDELLICLKFPWKVHCTMYPVTNLFLDLLFILLYIFYDCITLAESFFVWVSGYWYESNTHVLTQSGVEPTWPTRQNLSQYLWCSSTPELCVPVLNGFQLW